MQEHKRVPSAEIGFRIQPFQSTRCRFPDFCVGETIYAENNKRFGVGGTYSNGDIVTFSTSGYQRTSSKTLCRTNHELQTSSGLHVGDQVLNRSSVPHVVVAICPDQTPIFRDERFATEYGVRITDSDFAEEKCGINLISELNLSTCMSFQGPNGKTYKIKGVFPNGDVWIQKLDSSLQHKIWPKKDFDCYFNPPDASLGFTTKSERPHKNCTTTSLFSK